MDDLKDPYGALDTQGMVDPYSDMVDPYDKQKKTSSGYQFNLLDELKGFGAQALGTAGGLQTAGDYTAGVIHGLLGNTEASDAAFNRMKQQDAAIEAFKKRYTENTSPVSKVAGTLLGGFARIPELLSVGPAKIATQAQDEGANFNTAMEIAGTQGVANLAGTMVPGGRLMQGVANAASGALGDVISSGIASNANLPQTSKSFLQQATDPEALATNFAGGFALGGMAKNVPKDSSPGNVAKEILNQQKLDQPEKQQNIPQRQQDLSLDTPNDVNVDNVQNPYDVAGGITRHNEGLDNTLDRQGQGDLFDKELPSPLKDAIDKANKAIDDQYTRVNKLEDIIGDNGGMTSDMLPLRDKLVDTEYTKLDQAQQAREATGELPFSTLGRATNQGGMIHPDLLGVGAIDRLREKLGDLETFRMFKGTFDDTDKVLQEVKRSPNVQLAWMTREEFENLVPDRSNYGIDVSEAKRESIRAALKTESGLSEHPDAGITPSIPTLEVKRSGFFSGMGRVVDHDGRHRVDVLSEAGMDKFPVVMIDSSHTSFNYNKLIPQRETGNIVDMPKFMSIDPNSLPGPARPFVRRSESGAINPTGKDKFSTRDIQANESNGMSELARKASKTKLSDSNAPNALEAKQKAAVAKIPGLESAKQDLLKDPPIEDIKAQILSGPDIGKNSNWWIQGSDMLSLIKNNPVIYTLKSMFHNANARANMVSRDYIHAVEKSVKEVGDWTKAKDVWDVMNQEMLHKKQLTPEQLKSTGLTPKQIDLYGKFRTMFDHILDHLNESRLEVGLPAVKPHEGYLASIFGNGSWSVTVKHKGAEPNAAPAFWIREHSKGAAEAAIAKLKETHGDLIDIGKVEFRKSANTEGFDIQNTYDFLHKMYGDDPIIKAVLDAYGEFKLHSGEGAYGLLPHFDPKFGTRGYLGDRQIWKGNTKQETMTGIRAQLEFMRTMSRWAEMQKTLVQVNKLIADKDLLQQRPGMVGYLREQARLEMGYGTNETIRRIEQDTAHALGELTSHFPILKNISTDVAAFRTGIGVAKTAFYLQMLGFSVPFAATQFLQLPMTLPHHIDLMKTHGYNPLKTHAEGMMLAGHAIAEHMQNWVKDLPGQEGTKIFNLISGLKSKLNPFQRDVLRYINETSLADMNQFSDIRNLDKANWAKLVEGVGGISIRWPELVARTTAFTSFASQLKDGGKFGEDHAALFKEAEKYTNASMVNLKHTERAGIYNKAGLVGEAAFTLKSFIWNYLANMVHFTKKAVHGDMAPFASFMGVSWALGGALNLLPTTVVEDVYDLFRAAYQHIYAGTNKDIIEFSPKKWLMENQGRLMNYGLVSNMSGVGMAQRLGMGQLPTATVQDQFPFLSYDIVQEWGSILTAGAERTPESIWRAIYNNGPASLRGTIEVHSGVFSPNGQIRNINHMERNPVGIRTEEESNIRGMPFVSLPSLREQTLKDYDYLQHKTEVNGQTAIKLLESRFQEQIRTAMRTGDTSRLEGIVMAYTEWTGKPQNLINQIPDVGMRNFVTKGINQAMATKSGNLRDIRKVQQRGGVDVR